ncbi:MAG: cytochrome bc complex cytochrome b subunit [Thaumarchaeota archaeon]|nr:cytochrome bc complex cytochrome b subunit [Nitrososphaerota archaeon]
MADERSEADDGPLVQFVRWLDSRLGLSYPLLRPVPQYSINPFYWIGALTVVAFVIQAVTGIILLIWYVPDATVAYQSTAYVFNSVNYGRFLQTVHLYGAYAMILLAFMHMMRNYFVSSHKKPREMMWVVGMLMGFVTLGFGFTGYLLPWTVISVDATNVGLGLLAPLPPFLSSLAQSLLGTTGGDTAELVRFYDIHIVILPAVLLLLLFGKMYMFEAHGTGAPAKAISETQKKGVSFFPDATLYLLELSALFSAALLVISAVFPYTLPPQFSVAASQTVVPQPDWYFLWMYQILKIAVFEANGGLPIALTLITLIFVALFVLPFVDRGGEKRLANRPKFVILGVIFIAELAVLSYWGLVTPGQTIPDEQAALVLGGTALIVAVVFVGVYRIMFSRLRGKLSAGVQSSMSMKRAQLWTAAIFTLLLVGGALAISGSISSVVQMASLGITGAGLVNLSFYLTAVGLVVLGTIYLLYRLDLANGTIKTKVPVLQVGWPNEE